MLKFNEQEKLNSYNGILELIPEIEKIADEIYDRGFDHLFFLGLGGTYCSSLQVYSYMKGKTTISVYVENAAEFLLTGNKQFTKDSIVIFSSVSGTTSELIEAVKKAKETGAKVLGFTDVGNVPLADLSDWSIVYPENEQMKFFLLANRLMYRNGEFPRYDDFNAQFKKYFAKGLVETEKAADDFGKAFAEKHWQDNIHYFVGTGCQWGSTYSYGMCFWEEMHWIRTRSCSCSDFFHGCFEIIEKDTPITLFLGEDEQRPLAERVKAFLPKISENYTLIDSHDYHRFFEGIDPEFMGAIGHLITRAVTGRIDVYLEDISKHSMEIRRYYRKLDY